MQAQQLTWGEGLRFVQGATIRFLIGAAVGPTIALFPLPVRSAIIEVEVRQKIAMWSAVVLGFLMIVARRLVEKPVVRALLIGWMLGVLSGMLAAHLYAEVEINKVERNPFIFIQKNELVRQAMNISIPILTMIGLLLALIIHRLRAGQIVNVQSQGHH